MRLAMILVCCLVPSAYAGSGCGGVQSTSMLAAPVVGVYAAPTCGVQVQAVQLAPVQMVAGRVRGLTLCERIRNNRAQRRANRATSVVESVPVQAVQVAPVQMVAPCVNGQCQAAPVIEGASAPQAYVSPKYEQALRSAQYRAANGIHGHSMYDNSGALSRLGGGRSGVGWSSNNPRPTTCLGRGGANYVSVRGRDGWYSSKIE